MEELTALAGEIAVCRRCPLARARTQAVPGEGPANATLMFVGEAPGFHEDRQGRPFVGASGNLLQEMLASIGLRRSQVFITNVVKCRPPENRDPEPLEVEACSPYLDRQIALIQPKIIVTLGRHSLNRFLPGQSITRVHGQAKRQGDVVIMPMFHPAATLRNPQWLAAMRQDFVALGALVADLAPDQLAPQNSDGPSEQGPLQLSLF